MVVKREPQQVARRALVLGAVAFRASLEVTDHPRVVELSQRLLPWLTEVGCENELDPIEREELATPLGQLSDSQRGDVNWAGEQAAFFGWMLTRVAPLPDEGPTDQTGLLQALCILKPEASAIVRSASLRDHAEIEDACQRFVLVRSILQESRVEPPARDIVRRVNLKKLEDVGVGVTQEAIARATDIVNRMTAQDRKRAAGAYFVRSHAALWFLSGRDTYFG
jgi:hypothetical protein